MRQHAARVERAKGHVRVETDWMNADDRTLVAGMIADENSAWLAFMTRFDGLMQQRIEATLARWDLRILVGGIVPEVVSEIHGCLIDDEHSLLRSFNPSRGTLATWLSRLAQQMTMRYLQALVTVETGGRR